MRLRFLSTLSLIFSWCLVVHGVKDSGEDESTHAAPSDDKGKKMIDSLATNLAGAFMNSLFPQVSKAKKNAAVKKPTKEEVAVEEDPVLPPISREVRRSPVAYPQGLNAPLGQYSARQVAENYNAIPQDVPIDPREPLAFQRRPAPLYLGAQQHLPQEYQYSQQDALAAAAPGGGHYGRLAERGMGGQGLAAALAEGAQPRDPFQGVPSSFMNRRRAPSMSEPIPMGSMAKESAFDALMPEPAAILAGTSRNPGGMEAVNTLRNRQYMAKLAQHQHELQTYSVKQMEYLDQRQRYQQAMVDHQAGAALLMQQQQQALLEEQMERAKQLQESPFTGLSDAAANSPDNTVGGRLLTADTTEDDGRRRSAGHKRTYNDDDMVVTDDNLRRYFKEQYGIDIPEDGSQLTDDERDTLRLLRQELQTKKEEAARDGPFRTMTNMKGEMQEREYVPPSPSSRASRRPSSSSSSSSSPSKGCPPCIPVKLKEIVGSWTQIYGNPVSLKKTFSTIMSLEAMAASSSSAPTGTLSMTSKKPVCVGMEVSGTRADKAALNVFFRDDSEEGDVHEMKGELFLQEDSTLLLSTDMYNSQVCVVKAGPSEVPQLEYIVLAETGGASPCSSVHVFTRSIEEFQNRFYDDFADFMKTKLRHNEILPISRLPEAEQCQLT